MHIKPGRYESREAHPARLGLWRPLAVERLESRQLLAANVMITEFLAENDAGLRDADGNSPDWIELYNAGDATANLEGYRLTDELDEPAKWRFPAVELEPGQYLVVFASSQDVDNYVDSAGNLHASFALQRGGEYLALVSPGGQVLSEYGPGGTLYPEQRANVSYGVAQKNTWVDGDSDSQYWIPLDDRVEGVWTQPGFDAAAHGFQSGRAAIGVESRPGDRVNFRGEIKTAVPERTHAVYVRIPFQVASAAAVRELVLRLKYDNGFIAYLNGVEVARDNAPDQSSWFASAPDNRPRDADALVPVEFDLGKHLGTLRDGANVLALHMLNHRPDESDLLAVPELIAVIPQAAGPVGFMPEPSPGQANGTVINGFVAAPQLSVGRGFYDVPQTIEITTTTPGATIYYTTDGTQPGPANPDGSVYTAPLTIAETTALRAAAFRPGFLPTPVVTQTYVFVDDVARQPKMLSSITTDPVWGPQLPDSLLAVPTISITAGNRSLAGQQLVSTEIPVSVELILPDGSEGFQVNAGLEHYGGHTLGNSPKKNIRLSFKAEYGAAKLQYDLFGDGATDEFDQLILRTGSHDNWFWTHPAGNRGIYIRNRWATDRQLEMGQPAPHSRFVHVYIDGTYWGIHDLMERPNAAFMASYFGGNKEDYDALNAGTAVDGNATAWNALRRSTGDYDRLLEYLDPVNYADYMLLQFYGGNDWDWSEAQNWMAARKREEGAGWKFFAWDSDLFLRTWRNSSQSARVNVVNSGGPGNLWRGISQHPEFRMLLADRAQRYFFNGGLLTTERVLAQLEQLADELRLPLIAETARWDRSYTPATWESEIDRLLNDMIDGRDQIVIQQLRRAGLFPSLDAPTVLVDGAPQFGGIIAAGSSISLAAAQGTVYYTGDGTDPRLPGGTVSPTAIPLAGPFHLAVGQTLKARALHDGKWSALVETSFQTRSDFPLRITEVNYSPHAANPLPGMDERNADPDAFEFVELVNSGSQPLDLGGAQLAQRQVYGHSEGIAFTFAAQILLPGQRVVVARDRDAFESRYGTSVRLALGSAGPNGIDGQYAGEISDGGEQLTLLDPGGRVIHQFRLGHADPWPARARGAGSSLEIVDTEASFDNPLNWTSSVDFGGSPGAVGSRPDEAVVINEVLASAMAPAGDRIELYNTTSRSVDVSGWYISNTEGNYFHSRLPALSVLPAGGYLVVNQSQLGSGLDGARGDQLWLTAADAAGRPTVFVDQVRFEPTATDVSLGRFPDGSGPLAVLSHNTFGAANAPVQISEVILSEVHFRPQDPDGPRPLKADDFEFLELHNRTDQTVDVSGWRITGNVQFTLPAGASVGARQSLVIVPFRPEDVGKANVFRFSLNAGVTLPLYGPYVGKLDDQGNLLRLEKAEVSPPDAPATTVYVLMDGVQFTDQPPWPVIEDAGGQSLTRARDSVLGFDQAAWAARAPSPGTTDFPPLVTGDVNEDGAFDQADIERMLAGDRYLTGLAATWREGDWNGDAVFDQLDIVELLQAGLWRSLELLQ